MWQRYNVTIRTFRKLESVCCVVFLWNLCAININIWHNCWLTSRREVQYSVCYFIRIHLQRIRDIQRHNYSDKSGALQYWVDVFFPLFKMDSRRKECVPANLFKWQHDGSSIFNLTTSIGKISSFGTLFKVPHNCIPDKLHKISPLVNLVS